MEEAVIRVYIRCNVDLENRAGIPLFLEDLRAEIADKEKVTPYFTSLYGTRKGKEGLSLVKLIKDTDEQIRAAGFKPMVFGAGKELRFSHCLATSGGIVIHPDGSLYVCEQFLEKSRVGDIWQGVTDQSARTEFCRMDRIREKCRSCPFLPYCTGFSSCPIQDVNCRETHSMWMMETLNNLVLKQAADADEPAPVC